MNRQKANVEAVVLATARRVISTLNEEDRFDVDGGTVLFGTGSSFDSMGLLTFLLELEDEVERGYGRRIPLADERALSRPEVPFRTVELLTAYIHEGLGAAE